MTIPLAALARDVDRAIADADEANAKADRIADEAAKAGNGAPDQAGGGAPDQASEPPASSSADPRAASAEEGPASGAASGPAPKAPDTTGSGSAAGTGGTPSKAPSHPASSGGSAPHGAAGASGPSAAPGAAKAPGQGAPATPPASAPPAAAPPAPTAPPAPPPDPMTSPFSAALREAGITGGPGTGVAGQWWSGMTTSWNDLLHPKPPTTPQTSGQQAAATLRHVQAVAANIFGAVGVLQDMLNVGFANLTAPIAAVFPSLPAATIGMLYVGMPHTHTHPPSTTPPAPPIPLPSIGPIMLGTCVRVLINGMPAARCGDIGYGITCGGFFPFFQIKTGSSNTFIGGNRAARMVDFGEACSQADERKIESGKVMGAIGAAARGAQNALKYGGLAVGALGIAADAAEAATESDEAMQSAKALAAAMGAAQMAADLAAQALTKMMGKDPGTPPSSRGMITLGHPNVLIGGFPMVNIPNPVDLILDKLSRFHTKAPEGAGAGAGGTGTCPP